MNRKFFIIFAVICLSIIIFTNMFSFRNIEGLTPHNNKTIEQTDALLKNKKSTEDVKKKDKKAIDIKKKMKRNNLLKKKDNFTVK